jgi:exodeoxyribonuclease VII large subunit
VPTLVGVGHEVDVTLADLAADVRAATPTNAAEILVPDRREVIRRVRQQTTSLGHQVVQAADQYGERVREQLDAMYRRTREKLDDAFERLATLRLMIGQLNPDNVLRQGYAMLRGKPEKGSLIEVETFTQIINAEVKDVTTK